MVGLGAHYPIEHRMFDRILILGAVGSAAAEV